MSHRPPKEAVQVGIEGKKIRSSSHTPSLIARIHEPHFACIEAEYIVNLVAIYIILPKPKEPSKLLKGDLIPLFLSHPMKFSYVPRSSTYKVA
jgi:hypothetical protein